MTKLKVLPLLTATIAVSLPFAALAADPEAKNKSHVEYKDNGGYEAKATSEQESADGTVTKRTSKIDVDVDDDGETTQKVKNEATSDPEGLLNKKKRTETSEIEQEGRDGFEKTTKSKFKDADGTDISSKTTTKVDVDSQGNVQETVKNEKVVDPKGLFNRTKTSSTTKRVNGQVVDSDQDVDR